MTLSIVGNLGPSAGYERWVRQAFGLAHAIDLDLHISDVAFAPNAPSVICQARRFGRGIARFAGPFLPA